MNSDNCGDFFDREQIEKEDREAREWIERNIYPLPEEQQARWVPGIRRRLARRER